MKCISLWQPWATMIALGLKQFETRHWSTNHRGPLAIHAAKRWTKEQQIFTAELLDYPIIGLVLAEHGYTQPGQLPLGGIVCTVNLHRMLTTQYAFDIDKIGEIEYMLGDYSAGRYAWQLMDVKRFDTFMPCVGRQGLFNVDLDEVKP